MALLRDGQSSGSSYLIHGRRHREGPVGAVGKSHDVHEDGKFPSRLVHFTFEGGGNVISPFPQSRDSHTVDQVI